MPATHNLSTQVKKVKNISKDAFGTKLGRVHMKRQDFSKLQTRKLKGLKRTLADRRKQNSDHSGKRRIAT